MAQAAPNFASRRIEVYQAARLAQRVSAGKETLADLSCRCGQLPIKHFRMEPEQAGQGVGCSLEVPCRGFARASGEQRRNIRGRRTGAARRDRDRPQAHGRRLNRVSSHGSDTNYDFNVPSGPTKCRHHAERAQREWSAVWLRSPWNMYRKRGDVASNRPYHPLSCGCSPDPHAKQLE
jgi:hypothetical protein